MSAEMRDFVAGLGMGTPSEPPPLPASSVDAILRTLEWHAKMYGAQQDMSRASVRLTVDDLRIILDEIVALRGRVEDLERGS